MSPPRKQEQTDRLVVAKGEGLGAWGSDGTGDWG